MHESGRTPSMDGFQWLTVAWSPGLPGNGWCLRNAICELFDWPTGSRNWRAFTVEYPVGEDVERLVQHLGLVWLDCQKVAADPTLQDHPGVAFYDLDLYEIGHCLFQPHARFLKPLPPFLQAAHPRLTGVAVDITQAPRRPGNQEPGFKPRYPVPR